MPNNECQATGAGLGSNGRGRGQQQQRRLGRQSYQASATNAAVMIEGAIHATGDCCSWACSGAGMSSARDHYHPI